MLKINRSSLTGDKVIDADTLSVNAEKLLIQGVIDYAIYMLDPSGYVMSWNPGAERIKGYTADEIIGAHFSRFYTDEDRVAGVPESVLEIAAETGRFTTEAWRCRRAVDGFSSDSTTLI